MATPVKTSLKLCGCGCRAPIDNHKRRYTDACRKRIRRAHNQSRDRHRHDLWKSAPGRPSAVDKRLPGEPPRPKRNLCKVCFDTALPDRGAGTCVCGRVYEADLSEAAE